MGLTMTKTRTKFVLVYGVISTLLEGNFHVRNALLGILFVEVHKFMGFVL